MISDGGMRASDRDRDCAVAVLRAAHADGRLDLDEFLDRSGAAYSARTWRELRDLTGDLPVAQSLLNGGPEHGSYYEVADLHYAPRRPGVPMWATAVTALALAAVTPLVLAIPLLIISFFVLCANSLFVLCVKWARVPLVRKFVTRELVTNRLGQGGPMGDRRPPGSRRCRRGAGPAAPRCGR